MAPLFIAVPGTPITAGCKLLFRDDVLDPANEGLRVKFSANDLVRAVRKDSDAPIAHEGYQLFGLRGLDLGAEMLGVWDAGLSFDVDQDEIIVAGPEHGESFGVADGRVDVKSCERRNPVAKGADGFAGADVKDCAVVIYGVFHYYVACRLFARRVGSACIPAKKADNSYLNSYLTGGSVKLP